MLGVFEAEAVGYLEDGFPCRQPVLGKLDDELADVVARRVSGGFLDDMSLSAQYCTVGRPMVYWRLSSK